MAMPFDSRRVEATGTAVPVLEDVSQSSGTGATLYSISTSGSRAYIPGSAQANQNRLVWVSRKGMEESLAAPPRNYSAPCISPDGRTIAVTIGDQGAQTWLYDLIKDTLTRLTFGGSVNDYAVWTPDGSRLTLRSNKEGPMNLFWQPPDGSSGPERLTNNDGTHIPVSWALDGKLLAFGELTTTGSDIWILRIQDRKPQVFLRNPFYKTESRFSLDGRWLAYASEESGRPEI